MTSPATPRDVADEPSRNRALGLVALGFVAVAAAVYARTVDAWAVVFPEPGRVELLGIDPYYHLRHTRFAVEHFPHLARWDVGTHYPTGEVTTHPSLFNVLFAAIALVAGLGSPSAELVARVMAWSPVVLQIAAMGALFALARQCFGAPVAVFALLIYAAFPGFSLSRTVLGFGDHHALEIALWIATVWGVGRLLSPAALDVGTAADVTTLRARHWMACVAPAVVFLFSWSGAPLVLLVCAVALAVVTVLAAALGERTDAPTFAAALLGAGSCAALLVARGIASDLILDQERFWTLSWATFALAALGYAASRIVPSVVARLGARAAAASLGALLVVGVGIVLGLASDDQLAVLFGAKSALIHEHVINAQETLVGSYGIAAWLAVPAPFLALLEAYRRRVRLDQWFSVTVGIVLVMMWRRTNDYEYATAWVIAFGSAYVLWWLSRSLVGVSRRRRKILLAALLAALAVGSPLAGKGPIMSTADKLVLLRPGWRDAMSWLASATPRPEPGVYSRVTRRGLATAFGPGSYGVMSAWDYGNFVSVLGERTPVFSHGTSQRVANWLVSPSEEASLERLCPKCTGEQEVKYVVLSSETLSEHFMSNVRMSSRSPEEFRGERGMGQIAGVTVPLGTYGDAYRDTISARLYLEEGRNLGRYRVVYESAAEAYTAFQNTITAETGRARSDLVRISMGVRGEAERAELQRTTTLPYVVQDTRLIYDAQIEPSVKIFEVVRGAVLHGVTYPGARVVARLGLTSGASRRKHDYERGAVAGADGRFELVVAHSTDGGAITDFDCDAEYRVTVQRRGGGEVEVRTQSVGEQAVQQGRRIALGRLGLPNLEPPAGSGASTVVQSPPSQDAELSPDLAR